MKYRLKKIFTNARVIILLAFIIMAIVAINPHPGTKGVAIRSVLTNSSAYEAGIPQPKPTGTPMSKERIISINNKEIEDTEDYYDFTSGLRINQTVQVKTNKGLYRITVREEKQVIEVFNETETIEIEEIITANETINGTTVEVDKTIITEKTVPKTEVISLGPEDLGMRVYDAPTSNIRKGLDLQGGTRVLLEPEKKLSSEDLDILMDNMEQRLNVYGLSDLTIKSAGGLSGKQYILVEIAGANEDEIKDLLAKQGKFEARVANDTVFIGGQDINYVCRSATCAGIDPQGGCGQVEGGWACRFRFSITLSAEAAKKQAEATKDLEIIREDRNAYLSEPLVLYLDDAEVDSLNIGSDLRGKAVTDIQISGSGVGATQQEAVYNALDNMKRLQTILKTGSLPVKLNIVKTDAISPVLGEEFVENAILLALMALGVVFFVIFLRYRKLEVALPLVLVSASELIVLLGIAALIGWNLDLAAIAGIIIAIGTGVDHQVVITDETLKGETKMIFNWKERIKGAFFIIMGSYFTTMVAMVPLLFAGAGLLKGFAITTMIGVSIGVFISRPVYARVIEILLKE